jgi:long-chain acyl-CoA synthetase
MTVNPLTGRAWVTEHMPGVCADTNVAVYASVVDLFEQCCERFGALTAFECAGTALTCTELDRRAASVASFLQHECKVERGDRVAIMLSNTVHYPVTLFGVWRAGAVAVNIDPRSDVLELERQLNHCGAHSIIVLDGYGAALEAVIDHTPIEYVIVAETDDLAPPVRRVLTRTPAKRAHGAAALLKGAIPFRTALARGERSTYRAATCSSGDLAMLQYTAGTTAPARAAMLTHGNLAANVLQARAMFAPGLSEGTEVMVTALPPHNPFACILSCLLPIMIGARNRLVTDIDDTQALVRACDDPRVTILVGESALFADLLAAPQFDGRALERLKLAFGCGAIPSAIAENWHIATGIAVTSIYGLAEAPVVCAHPLHQPQWDSSVGVPLPSTLIAIRDDTGAPVIPGRPGELCVKGPQVIQGYWNDTEHICGAMTADGFLRTGDLATMDENGGITILDRKADLIVTPGGRIVPNEIEAILSLHPGVREAACVGMAAPGRTMALKCFVVRNDSALSADALKAFCRQNLAAAYKVPAVIEFRDTLPKSATGNTLRRALR